MDIHGRGTWIIKGDFLITNGNGPCLETDGAELRPCENEPGEDGLDTFMVAGTGALRKLVLLTEEGEEPFAEFKGAAKQFKLPDLLGASQIARKTPTKHGRVAGAPIQGAAFSRGIDIFDIRGRNLEAVPRAR